MLSTLSLLFVSSFGHVFFFMVCSWLLVCMHFKLPYCAMKKGKLRYLKYLKTRDW